MTNNKQLKCSKFASANVYVDIYIFFDIKLLTSVKHVIHIHEWSGSVFSVVDSQTDGPEFESCIECRYFLFHDDP